jgi:hypothetical protein
VELVAQLPELELFTLHMPSRFDHPTRLPDAWGRLPRLRRLSLYSTRFAGGLPAAWASPGAMPALQEL